MTPDDRSSQQPAPALQSPPAGWYANPEGPGLRWWDGKQWTEHVHAPPPIVPVTTTDPDRERVGIVGGKDDRLSTEARAIRILVILIVGAALVFGVSLFTDWIVGSVDQSLSEAEHSGRALWEAEHAGRP